MAKPKSKISTHKKTVKAKTAASSQLAKQLDTMYFLKILLYLILGSQWLRFIGHEGTSQFPVPIGMLIGLAFVMRDRFRIDRKIEIAVLLVAMFVGFWSQMGIYIHI